MLELYPLIFSWAYIPHGHCYLWQSNLMWLHIFSDSLIAIAYYSIPIMLVYFIRQREDVPFKSIVWLFSGFILSCGTTHLMEIWTLWHPSYWISGSLKAGTAIISAVTAVELFSTIPKALSLPSREELEAANRSLEKEVQKREKVENALKYRLDFSRIMADYSRQFINLNISDLADGINRALEDLAKFIGVEHSYVFKMEPEQETFSMTHAWVAQDFNQPEKFLEIPYHRFPWGTEKLRSGNVINVSSVANLPPECDPDKSGWESRDIKSLLCIPLSIQKVLWGWMGLASYTHEKEWSDTDLEFLRFFSEMVSNALNREQVEVERERAQQQLVKVFSQVPSLNCIAGADGYFKLLSPSFGTLLGYSTEELLNQPFIAFIHPDDHESTLNEVNKIQSENNQSIGFENRYRCRDGSYRWLSWYGTYISEEANIYATAVDVTERRQGEIELERKNRSLELLAQLTLQIRQSQQIDELLYQTAVSLQQFLRTDRVLILRITPEGCLVRAESVLSEQSAVTGNEFLDPCFATDYVEKYQDGRTFVIPDVSKADIQDCHRELLDQFQVKSKMMAPIFLQSQIWGLLIAHQCDAPRQWEDFEMNLLRQVADQVSVGLSQWQFLSQLESLVEQRTIALQRSENQFRSLFTAAPDLIYLLSPEGEIQTINPAVSECLGFQASELLHASIKSIFARESHGDCLQHLAKVQKEGFHRQDLVLQRKDGSTLTVDCACKLVARDHDPFILVLQRDISEQKRVEAMKDEFVSVVSHELRTPLTSIHGSLKLLHTGNLGDLSSQGAKVLDIALRNTDRLGRLINDVLDLERIESGKVLMSLQHCNVADLMVQAAQDMQSMASQNQVTLSTRPLDCGVYADPDHIIQTLTNLLSNAIKFSFPHGVVSLSAFEQERDILFEVMDQGRGIPKAKLEQIFERFQQVDVSDSRQKGGTGLGLPICLEIIERHHGKIWAESNENQGSTFYFTLPKSDRA